MALIKCPDCGKEISDKAPACPFCGCPMKNDDGHQEKGEIITIAPSKLICREKPSKKSLKTIFSVLIVIVLVIGIFVGTKYFSQSLYDKCAYSTAEALKEILKNPDSLSVYDVEFYVSNVETGEKERSTITDKNHPIVIMHYTAQNSYGGNTTGYVMSTYHKDSSKYEIDGYTYTLTMSEVSKYDQDADWQKFTIYLIKSCQENNKKIGSIDIKKLNRKIKNNL